MRKSIRLGIGTAVLAGTTLSLGGVAGAAPPGPKVTICHRTASHTNPYVKISVAQDSVDGNLANDNGRGDHYLEHVGPVGPTDDGKWGDIIPPIAGVHDGLNWDAAGQAVFGAGCGDPFPGYPPGDIPG